MQTGGDAVARGVSKGCFRTVFSKNTVIPYFTNNYRQHMFVPTTLVPTAFFFAPIFAPDVAPIFAPDFCQPASQPSVKRNDHGDSS